MVVMVANIYDVMGVAVAVAPGQPYLVPIRLAGIEDRCGWSSPLDRLFPYFELTVDKILAKTWELL